MSESFKGLVRNQPVSRIGDYVPVKKKNFLNIKIGHFFKTDIRSALLDRLYADDVYWMGQLVALTVEELTTKYKATPKDLEKIEAVLNEVGLALGQKPLGWKIPQREL